MRTKTIDAIAMAGLLTCLILTACTKTVTTAAATLAVDSSKTNTAHDTTVSFANYKTVALPDSVAVVNGITVTKELTSVDSAYLVALRSQFTAKGFSVVSSSAHPDMVLNITRIASTNNGLVDSTNYWSNYAAYYNPAIYGETGLTYTINFSNIQSVSDGILSFDLLDIKNASTSNQIKILWNGMISGYSLFSDPNSVSLEVSILFSKSTYL